MTAFGGQALTAVETVDPGRYGLLDAYAGVGALGPYWKMTATTSAPVILGTVRYTGARVLKIRQFSLQFVVTTGYTAAQFKTFSLRKVTGYTAVDTGGTDVSAYFGAPKRTSSPAVSGITAVVAGVPGVVTNVGLTAGTRTPLNSVMQRTYYVGTAPAMLDTVGMSLDEPLCIQANEGVELLLLASAGSDTTGSMSFAAQFDWTEEDF